MWYILDENNNPIPATIPEYGKWIENDQSKRLIAENNLGENLQIYISTIFYGFDDRLFEKMLVWLENEKLNNKIILSNSYEDAIKGHQKMVELVKKELNK